jgi:hypothetical protein
MQDFHKAAMDQASNGSNSFMKAMQDWLKAFLSMLRLT